MVTENIRERLFLGCSDFKKIIDNDSFFVDKSLFIKEVVKNASEILLLTRPRRFGKTLNLSMLRYFFEKTLEPQANRYLFENLNIMRSGEDCLDHLGEYPVIFFDA